MLIICRIDIDCWSLYKVKNGKNKVKNENGEGNCHKREHEEAVGGADKELNTGD